MMILLVGATLVGRRPETKLQADTGQYDDVDYIKTCEKCQKVYIIVYLDPN